MTTPKSSEHGFTLIDVLIGVTIVAVVVAVAYPGFKVANDTMATSSRRDLMERSADRTLTLLAETLRSGRIASITGSGTAPVVTLQSLKSGLNLSEFSSESSELWEASSRQIRFTLREKISESEIEEDLNRDGDRKDQFALGSIELVDGSKIKRLSGNTRIMLGLPSYTGDLDGDGTADPIFHRDGRDLHIRLTLMSRDGEGRIQMTTVVTRIHLRNSQN